MVLIVCLLVFECASELAPSVCKVFNKSLSSGPLPKSWKVALAIPIFKKEDRELVENYRPISLLCIPSKVLERCIFNRLINHLSSSLSSFQNGFLNGRSSVTQMLCFLKEQDRPWITRFNMILFTQTCLKHPKLFLILSTYKISQLLVLMVLSSNVSRIILQIGSRKY